MYNPKSDENVFHLSDIAWLLFNSRGIMTPLLLSREQSCYSLENLLALEDDQPYVRLRPVLRCDLKLYHIVQP